MFFFIICYKEIFLVCYNYSCLEFFRICVVSGGGDRKGGGRGNFGKWINKNGWVGFDDL